MQSRQSFAFVANVRALSEPGRFRLAPGHHLRRAKENEVEVIKATLGTFRSINRLLVEKLWECALPPHRGRLDVLPPEQWRYFVVEFRGGNVTLSDLESAFDIASVELETPFVFINGNSMVFREESRMNNIFDSAGHDTDFFVQVGAAEVAEIVSVYARLQRHDQSLLNITPALLQLTHLKGLPRGSPLRFLGYFALLESLLTHHPKSTDPYDSITRQVKKKLVLLDHRWTHKIDYVPFGSSKPESIWGKMYEYRSAIAHGGTPSFKNGLNVLRSAEHALRLLKETTKAVIRQALAEPRLIVDLRDC